MRFAAVAVVAASAAVASAAYTVNYGSNGIVAVNYGSCSNAKAVSSTILATESNSGAFKCNQPSGNIVWCYGHGTLAEACPTIRSNCAKYAGVYIADACTGF
ncbi:hypothetical protein GQ42DRAFT_163469 [Ramicandelaber brevisporus]|nr:hypothetical protein GQ42DRAFT_163469 [Ramicandelaber brevisporus]